MQFRPGSYMAATAHAFSALRRDNSTPQMVVVIHKPSQNYSTMACTRWMELTPEQQENYELVARLYKHNGPEIRQLNFDILR